MQLNQNQFQIYFRNLLLTSFIFLITFNITAKELSAEDGLTKINKNIETSQSNINDIQKNLSIVDSNIQAMNKTSAELQAQKKTLQNLYKENERIIQNHGKEMAKFDLLVSKEKQSLEDEKQKITKLEQVIAQLKAQQEKRNNNIVELQKNKETYLASKNKGLENQKQIQSSISEVDKNILSAKKELQIWTQKRKNNDKELAKWTKERDSHQKMQDDVKTLLEN